MHIKYCFYGLSMAALPLPSFAGSNDATSGNYQLLFCDPVTQTPILQTILPHIYENLQKVMADVALGSSSAHGFSALFQK